MIPSSVVFEPAGKENESTTKTSKDTLSNILSSDISAIIYSTDFAENTYDMRYSDFCIFRYCVCVKIYDDGITANIYSGYDIHIPVYNGPTTMIYIVGVFIPITSLSVIIN